LLSGTGNGTRDTWVTARYGLWNIDVMILTVKTQIYFTYSDAGYPDRLGPSGIFVEILQKIICLEYTGYRIEYCIVLWLLELQIRRGGKV